MGMRSAIVEALLRSAEELSDDERLVLAQRLIGRSRHPSQPSSRVDLNALAGTLILDEDPLEIQERMRREWQ